MVETISSSDSIIFNHRDLVGTLCSVNKGINIFHFNACSLNGDKLDYVRHVFESSKVDILCVSETWFKPDWPDCMYSVGDLRLYRNDRIGRRGGGVAIYCRRNLNASVVSMSDRTSEVEFINLLISDRSFKLLISCAYNSYRHFDLESYFTELNEIQINFDFILVCGDFNIDIRREDSVSLVFTDYISAAGLSVVNSTVPTRFRSNDVPGLLDYFLVSDASSLISFDQCTFVSDHDFIFCSLDIPLVCNPPATVCSFRDYSNINFQKLYADLDCVTWNESWFLENVDNKLSCLMTVIMDMFERYVPLKTVTSASRSTPWFKPDVIAAIKRRNILHSKWKKCPNDFRWEMYTRARNVANLMIKKAKVKYFSSQLNVSLSQKQLWKNLRKLRVCNKEAIPCNLSPDAINLQFTLGAASCNDPDIPVYSSCSVKHTFQFTKVNETCVAANINSITSNAVGCDGLPIKFLKIILPYVISPLTHIINHCFTTSTFPTTWKFASVVPIAKTAKAK